MFRRLQSYYQTAVYDLRYQSRVVLFWRAVVKLFSPVVRFDLQILYELDLTGPVEQRRPRGFEAEIGRATEADVDEILDMQMQLLPAEAVRGLSDTEEFQYAQLLKARAKLRHQYVRQMRVGQQCYVARIDGRIAHSNWTEFHDSAEVECRPVDLEPGEVYTTDGFTGEPYRGAGVHGAVLTYMLRAARERGCHRAYTITDLTKAASRRGLRPIGWRRRGQVLYITPRGLGRTWFLHFGGDVTPMFRRARALAAERMRGA